jgi:hypothetical protein
VQALTADVQLAAMMQRSEEVQQALAQAQAEEAARRGMMACST